MSNLEFETLVAQVESGEVSSTFQRIHRAHCAGLERRCRRLMAVLPSDAASRFETRLTRIGRAQTIEALRAEIAEMTPVQRRQFATAILRAKA